MSKLTDKAKSISFEDDDDTPAAAPVPVDRPRTAMGAISASIAMGRGVEAENRDLRAKLDRFEDVTVAFDPAYTSDEAGDGDSAEPISAAEVAPIKE